MEWEMDTNERKIFYGENCVKHTLNYDWEKIPPFLGFDIYDLEKDVFLPQEQVYELYKQLGLETVPHIDTIPAWQAKALIALGEKAVPVSAYPPKSEPQMLAEGLVFKNQNNGIYAKFVRDDFKEINATVFGGSPKYGFGLEAQFAHTYCTNARIEKQIFKAVDSGNKLDMPLMAIVPNAVWEDIWEEEWQDITKTFRNGFDFFAARKLITKRCLAVLKQIIINNGLNRIKNDKTIE